MWTPANYLGVSMLHDVAKHYATHNTTQQASIHCDYIATCYHTYIIIYTEGGPKNGPFLKVYNSCII